MLPPEALAPDVCFEGDLGTVRGKESYTAAASRWHADSVELLQYKTTLVKVASISEDEVVVRWRAEWEPPTLQWAPALAAALRWRIERFDVDPGVVSTFRWSSVFRLFAGAFATGVRVRAVSHVASGHENAQTAAASANAIATWSQETPRSAPSWRLRRKK